MMFDFKIGSISLKNTNYKAGSYSGRFFFFFFLVFWKSTDVDLISILPQTPFFFISWKVSTLNHKSHQKKILSCTKTLDFGSHQVLVRWHCQRCDGCVTIHSLGNSRLCWRARNPRAPFDFGRCWLQVQGSIFLGVRPIQIWQLACPCLVYFR